MDASPDRLPRTAVVALVGLGALTLFAVGRRLATIDQWLMDAMDPGPFSVDAAPPPPDYDQAAAWAARPDTVDGADLALPELPAIDPASAPAAVFYLHPTTWLGQAWNGPLDDPAVNQATEDGGTKIQASAFNGCCAVWAPRYRQAHGRAFTHPDDRGRAARDIAFADVSSAFDAFLAQVGDRPFLVVGHSQGAMLGARLVKERIVGTPLQDRLVATFLIGGRIGVDDVGGLPVCAAADDLGCLVAFNARGPRYQGSGLELDALDPDTLKDRACVNPLSWGDPGAHAPASAHGGAVFFDTPAPRRIPAFADAQCVDGLLRVTELGDLERDLPSRLLLWLMGPQNYHPVEFQLFYVDIRANAQARVDAWLAAHAAPSQDPPSQVPLPPSAPETP